MFYFVCFFTLMYSIKTALRIVALVMDDPLPISLSESPSFDFDLRLVYGVKIFVGFLIVIFGLFLIFN